jgi:thioredoxin reductase
LQLPFVEKHLVITGEEMVSRFANEVGYLEYARVFDEAEKVERLPQGFRVHTTSGKSHESKCLIIATGARGRKLNVPGEDEFMMRGLCYSAVSYAPLFIERNTVVIGDTALAIRATAELSRIALKVTLVAPGHSELDSAMGRKVLAEANVEVLEGFRVEAVLGDNYARTLVVSRDGERREIDADAFFLELELEPRSSVVADLVKTDEQDRIIIDARSRTSVEGIFCTGDVTDVITEQVLISVGEGAKAALTAYAFLLEKSD